jgi:hypothetical protein
VSGGEGWRRRKVCNHSVRAADVLALIMRKLQSLAAIAALTLGVSLPLMAEAEPQDSASAGGELPKVASGPTTDVICHAVAQAATDNNLPVEFFTRLVWQESRFNPNAVSSKGAQGIAQFMPRTASKRGLVDPFEPMQALREAASYLRELRTTFHGNLVLAAAAYNAGPGRVEAWLAGRRSLPNETRVYVRIVTGHTADAWACKCLKRLSAASSLLSRCHPPRALQPRIQ